MNLQQLVASTNTGFAGSMTIPPAGWATVVNFPTRGSDMHEPWVGPIKYEDADRIVLEVWGSTMTFDKNFIIVESRGPAL